ERSSFGDLPIERHAPHVAHRVKRFTRAPSTGLVHRDDRRVLEASRELSFPLQPGIERPALSPRHGVAGQRLFDQQSPAEPQIDTFPDLPHPAARDLADESIVASPYDR